MTLPLHLQSGRSPALAAAALCAILVAAIVAGHDGTRAAQVLLLALPVLLWMRWPLAHRSSRMARGFAVTAVVGLFVIDGLVRAYLRSRYHAAPESSIVIAAVANTTARESIEYLGSKGAALWLAGAALVLGLAAIAGLVATCNRHQVPTGRLGVWLLVLLLLVCSAGYLSKPWRRHHPALFWPTWAASVADWRDRWADQGEQRERLLRNAQAATPRLLVAAPSTVVLVLSDSVNRDNMSLYGYERDTTPQLNALSREEADRWMTLRYAWSVEASTTASLSGIFSFGTRRHDEPAGDSLHVLALARAAGYRVWWMSNHDDVAIEQKHARLADVVDMVNRKPGRSSTSLDGELLAGLETALADPAARKLIVVHLLGAHPHYRLRAPIDAPPAHADDDPVDTQMESAGRPLWLRELRQTYDAAILYHDTVVAETVRLTRRHAPTGGHAAWMYLSDHGQEVGHEITHAGHSPATAAGYRIPALLWRSGPAFTPEAAKRPFRADWAAWPLAELLGLEWPAMSNGRNVLHEAYLWEPPALPLGTVRFDR